MAKKRKTLPKEVRDLLKSGDIEGLKARFSRCEANAVTGQYGSNIFSLSPLPREFAFWAKEQGADPNFKDHYNKTPLFNHASAWDGDVPLLLELGADPFVADNFGSTPLHLAALYGRDEAVKALLNAGVDPNVKSGRIDWPGYMTPLEETLLQDRLPYRQLLEICTILLEAGAKITDRAREYLAKSAEKFVWTKRGVENQEFLQSQEENLEKLYKIFNVSPAKEAVVHDGVSPILIPEMPQGEVFDYLWNFLLPPRGKAQTAQGEAVRIAGRVKDEILGNGGINWDGDYRKMLKIFPEYLRLGSPLKSGEIAEAERICSLLQAGRDGGKLTDALCDLAVKWVGQNPEVLPILEADYNR